VSRAPDEPAFARRKMGRRRRRLYWTIAIAVGAAVLGTGAAVSVYRANRPETYRPGERHEEITERLARGLPDDAPQPRFADRTEAAGLAGFRAFAGARTSQLAEDMGPGAAWGDFDNDGDDDLFLVGAGASLRAAANERAPSLLYENLGDGTFAEFAGFPETRILGMGAAWGDADGDGWIDLVVTGYGSLRLFRNRDGHLERDDRFPEPDGFWAGASWGDFDRDGDLDLYVCGYVQYVEEDAPRKEETRQYGRAIPHTLNPSSYEPERNLLFRNRGDGTFDEVAAELGVANPEGRSLAALWHDFDEDGWLDLYVANDISDNVLFHNREGVLEDVSHACWVADYRGAMGLAAADYDRDGDDDLFITHWIAQENALYDSLLKNLDDVPAAGAGPRSERSPLRFVDVADLRGLGQIALQMIGWGAEFADFDGDGWLDLAVANGSTFEVEGEAPPRLAPQPSFLFWNRRGEQFHDLAPLDASLSAPRVSRGLAVSDYDQDGDVDLLIVDRDAGVRLLANEMQQGNWIELRLSRRGGGRGKHGFVEGARVVARVGETELRRTVSSVSYLSQSSRIVHIGLGAATRVDELTVTWPGGATDVHRDVAANALFEIVEGSPSPRRVELSSAASAASAGAAGGSGERERVVQFWEKQRAATRAMKVDGDLPRAIALYREALALDPGHLDSLYYLGNCLAETGDLEGAFETLQRMIDIDPRSHRAHKRWGTLRALSAGSAADLDAAAAALQRAVSINPEATGALQMLGEVALMSGDVAAARERLELVTRSNPQASRSFFLLAYMAWKRGDAAGAKSLLERARAARGEDWKPEKAVAEGEVLKKMHADVTPLARFADAWDGSDDPDTTFAELSSFLSEGRFR